LLVVIYNYTTTHGYMNVKFAENWVALMLSVRGILL